MRPDHVPDQFRNTVQSPDDTKKSKVLSSRIVNGPDELEEGEETEIAAQISVPHEGGWGWVVVASSFFGIFILDGIAFTYGSLFKDISEDLEAEESLVALINSIGLALYFMGSTVASAFINRYGFRACAMTGSIICSFSLFCSYFVTSLGMLCVSYGAFAGFGFSFINMSAGLVVGFYFERLRALAMSISTTGSSAGITIMFPLNSYLVSLGGWRIVTLMHSGIFGLVYFFSMAYKPLLSLTIMKTTDDATRTVTYLPSLASTGTRATPSRIKPEAVTSTATERLFSAVSNIHFPTAAKVVEETATTSTNQAGPSTAPVSKLTITAYNPHGGISQRQLEQVKSIMSKTSVSNPIEVVAEAEPPKKRRWWARLFHWEENVQESRPMYRDDAFYDGPVDKLPVYQKSMVDTAPEARTGLEYQMAVTRAVTTADLKDKRGIFTTAARRVLVTMMDPTLLRRGSFRCMCLSGFLMFLGYVTPYVFIQDRSITVGIDLEYSRSYVSVIGGANVVGKLVIGALAIKVSVHKLYYISSLIAGLSTIASNLSFNAYYQMVYCGIYGFFVASLACLRSVLIVELYGLECLTNATGIMLTFQGLGTLLSTPMASVLKNTFGYSVAFYVAGTAFFLSGVILIPLPFLCKKEQLKEKNLKSVSPKNLNPTVPTNTNVQ